jgi:transcription elongation GreA/GreB family factor
MSRSSSTAQLLAPARDGEAEIGERITVLDLTTSAVRDYRLVQASDEHTVDGELPIDSPLGSALLGRHVGEVVLVEDSGRSVRLEVVEIDG